MTLAAEADAVLMDGHRNEGIQGLVAAAAAEADAVLMDGHQSLDLAKRVIDAAEADAVLMDGHDPLGLSILARRWPQKPTRS